MNPIAQVEAVTLQAARELMARGAEFDATEKVLRVWFDALDIIWDQDPSGSFVLMYRGWWSQRRFTTFHEMLPILLGLIGTAPGELAARFSEGDV